MKPQNKDHFSGPANIIRVQQWRQENPGYWKQKNAKNYSITFKELSKLGIFNFRMLSSYISVF
jgi:hypothetical protein